MMMSRIPTAREALLPGLLAGALFSVAAAVFGRRDTGSAVAALNAPSHVAWGEAATEDRELSLSRTALGLLINLGAGLFWAFIMQLLLGRERGRRVSEAMIAGRAVSSLAWLIDYDLLPQRLSPGIEGRMSRRSRMGVHWLFAAGLGLGAWLAAREGRAD